MFPTQDLRMNGIYGNLGPPNMNGGMDINSLMQTVSGLVSQEHDKQRQHEHNMFGLKQQGRLAEIAAQMGNQQYRTDRPMNTVTIPNPDHITPLQQQEMDIKKLAVSDKKTTEAEKLNQGQQKIDQTGSIANTKNAISQQRANVYDFKTKNPGSKFEQGKDGILRAINPLTNKVTELGQTGMSDADVMALNQGNALERIDRTGQNQQDLQDLKGNQQTGQIDQKGGQNLADIAARIKGQQDLQNNKPSFYQGQFFQNPNQPQTYQGSGAGNPDAPPSTTTGKDTNLPNQDQTAAPAKPVDNTPKAPTGWKYVLKPDGKGYTAVKDTGGGE